MVGRCRANVRTAAILPRPRGSLGVSWRNFLPRLPARIAADYAGPPPAPYGSQPACASTSTPTPAVGGTRGGTHGETLLPRQAGGQTEKSEGWWSTWMDGDVDAAADNRKSIAMCEGDRAKEIAMTASRAHGGWPRRLSSDNTTTQAICRYTDHDRFGSITPSRRMCLEYGQ